MGPLVEPEEMETPQAGIAVVTTGGIVMMFWNDTYAYPGYVVTPPPCSVVVLVVRLEYVTMVVQGANETVVGVESGFGGQISVTPGDPVMTGFTEFQTLGST